MKLKSLKIVMRCLSIVLAVLFVFHFFELASVQASASFPDVNTTSNYYKPVIWASDNGIVNGYSNGYFGPEDSCTREQFVVMIWRLNSKPDSNAEAEFSDVNKTKSTYKAMRWAVGEGIIKGYNDGTFKPDEKVTRRQVAVMLWRMAGKPDGADGKISFSDISNSESTAGAIMWGNKVGIIQGYKDNTFKPEADCQRCHIVIFLYRYVREWLGEDVSVAEPAQSDTGETRSRYSSGGNRSVITVPEEPQGNSGSEIMVWIPTNGGTKYHSKPSCSGMVNPAKVTSAYAEEHGYTSCKKCH